jgi:hypothetical protein
VAERVGRHQRLFPNEMPDDPEGFKVGMKSCATGTRPSNACWKRNPPSAASPSTCGSETADGFALTLRDEDGIEGRASIEPMRRKPAKNPERALVATGESLGKLGTTDFKAGESSSILAEPWFLPASAVNALRRDAVDKLGRRARSRMTAPVRARRSSRRPMYPSMNCPTWPMCSTAPPGPSIAATAWN